MASSTAKSSYWRGVRDGMPFLLVIVPFALLFGVVGTEAGLDLAAIMGFSVFVIAGASQFTAVSMIDAGAPAIAVLATALAVNLRMAMYSASLAPHLGKASFWMRACVAYLNIDQTYATAIIEYERRPAMTTADKLAYFFGVATPIAPAWYLFTLVGALIGEAIPPAFALDFAVPITFLALTAPMLKSLAHVASAATSVVVALALVAMPAGTGLLIAAAAAMLVGAGVETLLARRLGREAAR